MAAWAPKPRAMPTNSNRAGSTVPCRYARANTRAVIGHGPRHGAKRQQPRELRGRRGIHHQEEHHAQTRAGVDAHRVRTGQVIAGDSLENDAGDGQSHPDQNAQH